MGAPSPWGTQDERAAGRAAKREALLRAAVRSFNEKGFHATSLDDVAAALHVTKPTIYHHLGNKDEILFECVRRGLQSIGDAAAAVERTGGSGMQRLRALMHDYAEVMTTEFGQCVTRTADHELSPDSRRKFRALKREIDEAVRRIVEEGMADGSIARGDPAMTTFVVAGALNWIGRWYEDDRALSAQDVARLCVSTLVDGLAPRHDNREEKK